MDNEASSRFVDLTAVIAAARPDTPPPIMQISTVYRKIWLATNSWRPAINQTRLLGCVPSCPSLRLLRRRVCRILELSLWIGVNDCTSRT